MGAGLISFTPRGCQMPINNVSAHDLETFMKVRHMNAYQELATRSAAYPGKGTPLGLAYCALKLNGESGELAEHVGKAMRDDGLLDFGPDIPGMGFVARPLSARRRALIIKEAGDVLWYLAAICNELGITLEAAAGDNLNKIYMRGVYGTSRGTGDDR